MDLEVLKKENEILKRKLSIAQKWMEREVKYQINQVAKNKLNKETSNLKDTFFTENVEEMVTESVTNFFGELMLLNTPETVIENLISAEISFYNMRNNPSVDGLGVITSYHKSIDILIESTITKPFRKFAKKKGQVFLRVNDPLEKSLNLVVNKGYILGIGKLFHILQKIIAKDKLDDYSNCFKEFLEKNNYISDILFDEGFYKNFKELINTDIIGKKRHIGKINFEETKKARKLLIGDLKVEDSIIYKLIEMGKPDF